MFRSTEVVHETHLPLLALERHELELDEGLMAGARRELLDAEPVGAEPAGGAAGAAEPAFRSGFLLGVQADRRTHPACIELADVLRAELLAELERARGLDFALSFYKLALGAPPNADDGPFYEGCHLDTHPELTDSSELLRLLVNLSVHPRRFLYAATDRWRLADDGVGYGRRDFERLVLPVDTPTRVVALPGRTATSVHALRFLASAVPHVGLNDPPEHFLVSFEAVAPATR